MSVSRWPADKIVVGLGAAALAYLLYRLLKGNGKDNAKPPYDEIPEYLLELRKTINQENPSMDNLKSIVNIQAKLAKSATHEYLIQFRQERRKYFNVDFVRYLATIVEGVNTLEEIPQQNHTKTLHHLGLSTDSYEYACMQHHYIFEYVPAAPVDTTQVKSLSLEQIREVFRFQKRYLEKHDIELEEKIKAATLGWDLRSRSLTGTFIGYILADVIHAQMGFYEDQVEFATNKFKAELAPEMEGVRALLVPILKRSGSTASVSGSGNNLLEDGPSEDLEMEDDRSLLRINPVLQNMDSMDCDPEMMERIMAVMHNKDGL